MIRYCNNNQLNETNLKTWKLFGQRYSEFKQKNAQLKNLNQKNFQSLVNTTASNGDNKAKTEKNESLKFQTLTKNAEFNEWDYVNTTEKIYMLTDESLNSEKIIYLNKNFESTLEIKGSEKNIPEGLYHEKNDLDLSETESISDDDDDECFTTKESNQNFINIEENALKIKSRMFIKDKPTLKDLYFNMYDNLSKDKLFYIVDNQYTIVPDSYIVYINKKREIYFQQLKLANSIYFQKKWLNLSLDLEFKIN